jgi:RNA polymerase sigma factor (TIGR02999 family)
VARSCRPKREEIGRQTNPPPYVGGYSFPIVWRPGRPPRSLLLINSATLILNAIEQGDPHAAEQLLPLVYEELRKLAAHAMSGEAPGHTLQPTALVHEAWLRLIGGPEQRWNSRGHFFAAAAEAMRRILIENARRKHRLKHGGGLQRVDFEEMDVAIECPDEQLLAVDEALAKLESKDKECAELIKLRFFAGLSNVQAAQALGVPERTAKRRWAFARAWLYEELRGPRAE